MNYEEAMERLRPRTMPRSLGREEHELQKSCVEWFGWQYPKLRGLLFAVPNGGQRSKAEASRLRAEGVVAGVSDLVLLDPLGGSPLLIEMKTPKGRQSAEQQEWQATVERHFHRYVVCRSLEEFRNDVRAFLLDFSDLAM